MYGEELITRTKFLVPPPRRGHLSRARLERRLAESLTVPLTVVLAGTGYGKSSLLSGYAAQAGHPCLWYALTERDADPQVFALHLAHLFHRRYPGSADRALSLLALPGGAAKHGMSAIETLADALLDRVEPDTWLVLDDFHLLHAAPEAALLVNHLIQHRPPHLHVVLGTRERPELPDYARWRLQQDVLVLDQATLAFTPDEIEAFFTATLGKPLQAEDVERLRHETEGWAMALQLFSQRLLEHDGLPERQAGESQRDLFDYLAREVLSHLSERERSFLLETAVLQRLEPELCRALTDQPDAALWLKELNDRGLFLIPQARGSYRHHHLFREFLLERLREAGTLVASHRKAADLLLERSEDEEAIDHLLWAGDHARAAGCMARIGPRLVKEGRFARLDRWVSSLPDDLVDATPRLSLCQGDAMRLMSRYDEAIHWLERAEKGAETRSEALGAMAQVYLDTLQPAFAERYLEEALASVDTPEGRAEQLLRLAENKLNQGDARQADALYREAHSSGAEALELEARLYLRTGRLNEGKALLQDVATKDAPGGTKAHREASLVLSFLHALLGEPERAREFASLGLERAKRQGAMWAEAVAHIRLGHAHLVMGELERARAAYDQALSVAGAVGVVRLKAEPLMGLAIVSGRRGDLAAAESLAKEGLDIAKVSGDTWLAALLSLALGALYATAGDPKAERWLLQAETAYEQCSDTYGLALCRFWFARLALALGEHKALVSRVTSLAQVVRQHGYDMLLTRPSLLGFTDLADAQAFWTTAMQLGVPRATLTPWLQDLGLSSEPQSTTEDALRIRALGKFRIWRGPEELGDRAWGREKARQLFHLLLTYRGQVLPKSRLIDLLWPDLDPKSADQTFRVALNALNKALEPERASGQPSRFICKEGLSYGLVMGPDLWLDVAEFERGLDAAMALGDTDEAMDCYREALELYEGEFLQDFPQYEAWCELERERLSDRYTDASLRLLRLLTKRGDDAQVIHWAQRLLERNRVAEEAYRHLMTAYYRQGDRAMAMRTYDRCVEALGDELDVDPMPETELLFDKIYHQQAV